jgi:hypothetical protein
MNRRSIAGNLLASLAIYLVKAAGGLQELHADEEKQPTQDTRRRNELHGLWSRPFGLGFSQGRVDVAGQFFFSPS